LARNAADERKALTTFFQTAAVHLGLFDRRAGALREGAEKEPVFLKNQELLRDLKNGGLDLTRFIEACRFTLREKPKRDYLWVTDVTVESEDTSPDRNLIKDGQPRLHRLLKKAVMPASRICFGATASVREEGEFSLVFSDTFTMGELIEHFTQTFGIEINATKRKAFVGAFNHLLASYSLDVVLFAIDAALTANRPYKQPARTRPVHSRRKRQS